MAVEGGSREYWTAGRVDGMPCLPLLIGGALAVGSYVFAWAGMMGLVAIHPAPFLAAGLLAPLAGAFVWNILAGRNRRLIAASMAMGFFAYPAGGLAFKMFDSLFPPSKLDYMFGWGFAMGVYGSGCVMIGAAIWRNFVNGSQD